jgi:uracil-DNA glycosylase
MTVRESKQAAIDALTFQLEAGVDVALADAPINRFEESASSHPPERGRSSREARREGVIAPPLDPSPDRRRLSLGSPKARPGGRSDPPLSGEGERATAFLPGAEEAVSAAREMARSAATLEQLQAALARFEGCALRFTAKQLVFADGNPNARVMFVGEAPGAEEDREGLPFVGRAGKLLDRMLASIELDRTRVYIANIVPWRPPGNRTPTPQESAICYPFIRRQIELANPDFLVCLGRPSMQTLLGIKDGIRGTRGRWFDFDTGTRTIRALVSFHPAYLLRSPLEKRHSWRDMLALKKALDG